MSLSTPTILYFTLPPRMHKGPPQYITWVCTCRHVCAHGTWGPGKNQSLRAAVARPPCGPHRNWACLCSHCSSFSLPHSHFLSATQNYFPVISQHLAWQRVTVSAPSPPETHLSPVPQEVIHPKTFLTLWNFTMKYDFSSATTVCCVGISHPVNLEPVVGESGFMPGGHA